ncbi:acyltransferase family protein [Pseudoduganella sp. HUAS MS19]
MTAPNVHPKYRPDIDGLRALAIISVVVFHAVPGWASGGFVGVDVFFVISGYLISLIVFKSLENNEFSLAEFYSHRVRRIFPALVLVVSTAYAAGWFILLSEEFKQLGKHIAAGMGFAENLILWKEAGYFDVKTELKPLMHLWSLAVEEQFYLIYPFLVWILWKIRFNVLVSIVLLGIVSFGLNAKGVHEDAVKTFFAPHMRFWELMVGAAIAYVNGFKVQWRSFANRPLVADVLAAAGLLLVGVSIAAYDRTVPYPGVHALAPVFGAALLIFAGPQAWLNRNVLSSRVLVWVGLISYPLYLWHWVLLAFLRIIQGEEASQAARLAAVALSILLSWLTYQIIERPLRFGGQRRAKTAVLLMLALVLGLIGYGTYLKDGLTFRRDAQFQNSRDGDTGHLEYHKYIAEKYFLCTPGEVAAEALKWDIYTRCMQSKPADKIDVALIGDSHAEHLFIGMAEALPEKNVVFYIKGSLPFLGNPEFKNIYRTVIESPSIKTVILTMHWVARYSEVPKESALDVELIKAVDALSAAGKTVYITDDVPVFPFDPEKCKGSRRFSNNSICKMPRATAKSQEDVYYAALRKVVGARPAVKILPLAKYICDEANCSMTKDDSVLYRDHNHLNIIGSTLVGRKLVEDNFQLFKVPVTETPGGR